MTIYDDSNPRPDPVEESPRWTYTTGTRVLFIAYKNEPTMALKVRTI
jgi:hypothetical protein